MKVSGCVFQRRKIIEFTSTTFNGIYKGKTIYVSSVHGLGKPEYDHLTRYNIEVTDNKSGMFDVDTYQDFHDMRSAIHYALESACIIK